MKAVDAIDTEKKVEKLTGEEKDDFFTKMVMGKDVTDEIETSRGTFTVKYPKPKDVIAIGKIAAYRRDYKPVEAFDEASETENIMTATLDVMVVSGPEWYENARKANKFFSFTEVPSRKFLAEFYSKAYSFRGQVEKCFDEGETSADQRVPAETGVDDPVDGGTFGGLSSE
ncbi:MAG: hypothetical protein LBG27_03220 [Spirochaetaceae bacterium]|jgi:hypothetical protein|nr:hypothetical protein [Spirochaetaceae bacterium]